MTLLLSSLLVACGGGDSPEPVALEQSLEVQEGHSLDVTLGGAGSGELSFAIVSGPAHGSLEGTAPELTYVPDAHHLGEDAFTFTVSRGDFTSEPATVTIDVVNTPFYAITRGNDEISTKLYIVEQRRARLIGDTGHSLITLKVDPTSGTLFAVTRTSDFEGNCDNCLVTLNTTTGAATVVGEITGNGGPVPSIVFTSTGELFGWTEAGDDAMSIDKETAEATVLGASGVGTYAHGMWADEDDTLWFINGDGYVYVVDPEDGSVTEMHVGEDLAESAGISYEGDFQMRGDINPATGTYWGVSPGYGDIIASGVTRFVIDADGAEYVGTTPVETVPAIHNLAFVR